MPKKDTYIKTNLFVAIFLIIGLGFLVYFLPCPTDIAYIYFKVVISLAAASFSAILLGFIRITHSFGKTIVTAGGGFAIFLIVFKLTPSLIDTRGKCAQDMFVYTFFLRDSTGASIKNLRGKVTLQLGNNSVSDSIRNSESIDIKGIASIFKDSLVRIELQSEGWCFMDTKLPNSSVRLTNDNATLKLIPDETLCCIEGRIKNENGVKLSNAKIILNDIVVKSDLNGWFRIVIPPYMRKVSQQLEISREDYKSSTVEVFPASKEPFTIILEK
jgi:hypothetical protein